MEKFSEDLSAKLRQHVKAWDEDLKALCNDTMSTHEDFQLSPTVTNNGRARPAPAECSDDDWEYHIPKNLEIVITKTPVSMGYDVSQCVHHDTVQFQHDNQGRVSNQHPAGIEATPASGELMAPPAGSESGQGEKEGGDQPPPCKTPRCQNGGAGNLKPGNPKKPMIDRCRAGFLWRPPDISPGESATPSEESLPSESTSCAWSMPTWGPPSSKSHDIYAPTLSANDD
jgi:hypothetical protein